MFVTQRIRLSLTKESEKIINKASARALRLYNMLLDKCFKGELELSYRKILGLAYFLIRKNEDLKIINKDTNFSIAKRLIEAFKSYKEGRCEKPRYHSLNHKWFSLYFIEDVVVHKRSIEIRLLNRYYKLSLREKIRKNKRILSFRIIKEVDEYYLMVLMEKDIAFTQAKTGRTLAIDPNHTNFFMAVSSDGISYEMENLSLTKYFHKKIVEVKNKRDNCQKVPYKENCNNSYIMASRKYKMYSKIIYKLYLKRKRELKDALFAISNYLVNKYDVIAIGNYAPRKELATNNKMRYKMINETVIGEFRDTLEYVAMKKGKRLIRVDEKNTTALCFNCKAYYRKNPDIRTYTCPSCHKTYNRDINSAINIGLKAKILSAQDYVDLNLEKPTYALSYSPYEGLKLKEIKWMRYSADSDLYGKPGQLIY